MKIMNESMEARRKDMSDFGQDKGRETPPTTMLSTIQFNMISPTVAFVENPDENVSVSFRRT